MLFPFQLSIKNISSKNNRESLRCLSLLRAIPGRRYVYDASWNNRKVIVKVFSHKISAKRHLKKEWRGLSLLRKRSLSAPAPLFFGKTDDGSLAMVTEKIADSSTAWDVFNKTTSQAARADLLVLVCKELARQHSKGVLQKDLHLGNFLLQKEKVFAIDAGQMRFLSGPLSKRKSISQLALLVYGFAENDSPLLERLCEEYAGGRNWRFDRSDMLLFAKWLAAHRKKGIKTGLKKCLRTSRRHLKIRAAGYKSVLDKNFCPDPLDFINHIDALMDGGEILKKSNTCYVSRVSFNGRDVVIKRYNHKGFIYALCHIIKTSRARRVWLCGHMLGMLKITTPKPVAYIEQYKGPLVWTSYIITEYIEGENLFSFMQNDNITGRRRSELSLQLEELLAKLKKYKISHGDLKPSNILITDSGPVLTDLDGMRIHRCRLVSNRRHSKDLNRFTRESDTLCSRASRQSE